MHAAAVAAREEEAERKLAAAAACVSEAEEAMQAAEARAAAAEQAKIELTLALARCECVRVCLTQVHNMCAAHVMLLQCSVSFPAFWVVTALTLMAGSMYVAIQIPVGHIKDQDTLS